MAYEFRTSDLPLAHAGEGLDDDAGGRASSFCTNCGAKAPMADSESTLISRRGWRLVLETDAAGCRVGAWRCPTCWSRHRSAALPRTALPRLVRL
jgi:hypothetical protein